MGSKRCYNPFQKEKGFQSEKNIKTWHSKEVTKRSQDSAHFLIENPYLILLHMQQLAHPLQAFKNLAYAKSFDGHRKRSHAVNHS